MFRLFLRGYTIKISLIKIQASTNSGNCTFSIKCSCASTKSSLAHFSSALDTALAYANSYTSNSIAKPNEKSQQLVEIPK